MVENLRITRAALPDAAVILRLLIPQFEEHHIPFTPNELEEAVRAMIEDERLGFILLAYEGDKAIGVAVVSFAWTLEYAGKTAWIDELFVTLDRRGQGVGTALIRQVYKRVKEMGCRAVDLEVDQDHRRVQALYQREGFLPLKRSRWYKLLEH